jgi:hypothetical protein
LPRAAARAEFDASENATMRHWLLVPVVVVCAWSVADVAPARAQALSAPPAIRADGARLERWCVRAVRRTYGAPGPRGGYRLARHRMIPLVSNCIASGGTRV